MLLKSTQVKYYNVMMFYINQWENHVSAYFDFIVIHMYTWPHGLSIVSFLYFIYERSKMLL